MPRLRALRIVAAIGLVVVAFSAVVPMAVAAADEPTTVPATPVCPPAASYNTQLKEFVLPYEAVQTADAPDEALLAFARSTYDAASTLGDWDRAALVEIKPDLHSQQRTS